MAKYKVISLFCGAGGMDLGFHNAGFDIVWANDYDQDAIETYNLNINHKAILGNIIDIDKSTIPDADIVIGGFPCQGFSIANTKRNMQDERNYLYKQLLEVVKIKKPKIFIAENVKGLLSMENGKIIDMIVNDFEQLGYKVDYKILNSVNYGVPQSRERIIIIGNRLNIENKFPNPIYTSEDQYITVKDAIEFLMDVDLDENDIIVGGKQIFNHEAYINVANTYLGRKHDINQADICDYLKEWKSKTNWSVKKIDEYFGYKHTAGHWFRKDNKSGSIPKPEDWWKLKKILNFDDKYDKEVTEFEEKEISFEQSLRITNWDRPSDTITATGPEIHINNKRRLSVRECAILQSFPLDFKFTGSLNSMYRQVGNAVPVILSEHIANSIMNMLNSRE